MNLAGHKGRFLKWATGDKNRVRRANSESQVEFILEFLGGEVGRLSKVDDHWQFEYSANYTQVQHPAPIVNFPDINRSYRSRELWPFFQIRIPSTKRSDIAAIAAKANVKPDDTVGLLKLFGRTSIANPYILIPQF